MPIEIHRNRLLILEIGVISSIPLVLAAIHFLAPAVIESKLIFRYNNPDPFTALTAAYFHIDNAHLYGNIKGYLVGAVFVYFLCILIGERQWFWLTTVSFVTLLPILVNFTSSFVIGEAPGKMVYTERGFSGVVAGYAGFLLVASPVVLWREFQLPPRISRDILSILIIAVGGEVVFVLLNEIPIEVLLTLSFGAALVIFDIVNQMRPIWQTISKNDVNSIVGGFLLTVVILATLSWIVLGLFLPTDSTTNILAHYVGIVYGGIIAIWGYRYWNDEPDSDPRENWWK